ncbi:MAG TPA: glycosyltransferase family 2 protein, partial [Paraburkholderia sp.]
MTPSARSPISACIITLNEADRIDACIESLRFCDEIIVIDSGSADGTRDRAVACGARVIAHPFEGYRAQKDFAARSAQHDWVLCLDADERVTDALRASIQSAQQNGFADASGFRFARATE